MTNLCSQATNQKSSFKFEVCMCVAEMNQEFYFNDRVPKWK